MPVWGPGSPGVVLHLTRLDHNSNSCAVSSFPLQKAAPAQPLAQEPYQCTKSKHPNSSADMAAAPQPRSAAAKHTSIKATPVERIAGLAFFAFTLMQVAFFVVDSDLSASGLIMLSPLQVSAANLARQFPQAFHYIDDVLVPGAWVRESLSPYIQCQFKTGGKGPCEKQRSRLFDLQYVRNGTNLPLLVELVETEGIAAQQYVVYGCSMIVLSALFSLYYSVKTAVLGFVLLGYGIYAGNHIPLPPMVLVAFLCVYAGFNLGEARGGASVKQLRQRTAQQAQQQGGSSKGTGQKAPQKTPSKGSSQRKQRKA